MKPCKHPCCPDTGPCRKSKIGSKYRTNRYSAKRQKINKSYSTLSKQFLQAHPLCEIQSLECTSEAEGVHHKRGRGIFLMDQSTWMAACNTCNRYIELKDKWVHENGFKQSRLTPK